MVGFMQLTPQVFVLGDVRSSIRVHVVAPGFDLPGTGLYDKCLTRKQLMNPLDQGIVSCAITSIKKLGLCDPTDFKRLRTSDQLLRVTPQRNLPVRRPAIVQGPVSEPAWRR